MQIHQMMKGIINEHKKKIELIQWAIINGISSLLYSEYIRRFKYKTHPVEVVLVPQLRTIHDILNPDGEFIKRISEKLIDEIVKNELFKKHSHAPELILFNGDNLENMKIIFDLYIIPNIIRRIPESIGLKFQLNDQNQRMIRQDRDISLFNKQNINNEQYQFITEQIVLQLLSLLPTMKKSVKIPEDNCTIQMNEDEILVIGNKNAICPIYINKNIINNKSVINLLSFVTSTSINTINSASSLLYNISTNIFNEVGLITLEGIEINTEAK